MADVTCKRCKKEVRFPVAFHPACWETEVGNIIQKFCDDYCRFPRECENQDELEEHCDKCVFINLLNSHKETE